MKLSELRKLIKEEARAVINEHSIGLGKSVYQFLKQSGLNGSLEQPKGLMAFLGEKDEPSKIAKQLQNLNLDYIIKTIEYRSGYTVYVYILNTNKAAIEELKRKFNPQEESSVNGMTVLKFGI